MSHSHFMQLVFWPALFISLILHELGHYGVARLLRVPIRAVRMGLGPRLFGWSNKGGISWSIHLLPFSGYVMIDVDRSDPHTRRLMARAIAVLAAGPLINIGFAVLVFFSIFATKGEFYYPPKLTYIKPGYPAQLAGIKPGDTILSINGIEIKQMFDIERVLYQQPHNASLPVRLLNSGQERTVMFTPLYVPIHGRLGPDKESIRIGIGYFGPVMFRHLGTMDAMLAALRHTHEIVWLPIMELHEMLVHGPSRDPHVVITAANIVPALRPLPWPKADFFDFLTMLAVVSANLGLVNLYPLPRFDGQQIMLYAAEFIKGSRLTAKTWKYLYILGPIFVMSTALVMFRDNLVRAGVLP